MGSCGKAPRPKVSQFGSQRCLICVLPLKLSWNSLTHSPSRSWKSNTASRCFAQGTFWHLLDLAVHIMHSCVRQRNTVVNGWMTHDGSTILQTIQMARSRSMHRPTSTHPNDRFIKTSCPRIAEGETNHGGMILIIIHGITNHNGIIIIMEVYHYDYDYGTIMV